LRRLSAILPSTADQTRGHDRGFETSHAGLDQEPEAAGDAVCRSRLRALEGTRVVGTGQLVAQPYIGTKLAKFGAEVIHVKRPGGDVSRITAPH
jgi:hypothetical protein